MISLILGKLNVFNSDSVWALYLLQVIIWTASFCILKRLWDLKARDNMQYCRWGRMELLHRIFNTCWGKKSFD